LIFEWILETFFFGIIICPFMKISPLFWGEGGGRVLGYPVCKAEVYQNDLNNNNAYLKN
jgi:hypothetical protein